MATRRAPAHSPPPAEARDRSGAANPAGTYWRAYVFLHDVNRIAVVDLSAGSVVENINVSDQHVAKYDADGSVDMTSPVLHAGTGRIYFFLGRVDRTTITSLNHQLICSQMPPVLMALDLTTDTLVSSSLLKLMNPVVWGSTTQSSRSFGRALAASSRSMAA